jgi:hypothetical protein
MTTSGATALQLRVKGFCGCRTHRAFQVVRERVHACAGGEVHSGGAPLAEAPSVVAWSGAATARPAATAVDDAVARGGGSASRRGSAACSAARRPAVTAARAAATKRSMWCELCSLSSMLPRSSRVSSRWCMYALHTPAASATCRMHAQGAAWSGCASCICMQHNHAGHVVPGRSRVAVGAFRCRRRVWCAVQC